MPQPTVEGKEPLIGENLLEGGILVHGFEGNIGEFVPLKDILDEGGITSPNLRQNKWSEKMRERQEDVAFDNSRLCLHVYKPGKVNRSYTFNGSYFFACPMNTLAKNVIMLDDAGGTGDIAAYHAEGVKISIEQGVLFLPLQTFQLDWEHIRTYAEKQAPSDPAGFIRQHFRISQNYETDEQLLEAVQEAISPAQNVTYSPKRQIDVMGLAGVEQPTVQTAREDELGKASIINHATFPQKWVEMSLAEANTMVQNLQDEVYIQDKLQYQYFVSGVETRIAELKQLIEILEYVNPDQTTEYRTTLEQLVQRHLSLLPRTKMVEEQHSGFGPRIPLKL